MLLQEKLEEIDQIYLLVQLFSSVPGKTLLLAIDYMISSRIRVGLVLNTPHRSGGGGYGQYDSTSVVELSSTTITYDGRLCGRISIKS